MRNPKVSYCVDTEIFTWNCVECDEKLSQVQYGRNATVDKYCPICEARYEVWFSKDLPCCRLKNYGRSGIIEQRRRRRADEENEVKRRRAKEESEVRIQRAISMLKAADDKDLAINNLSVLLLPYDVLDLSSIPIDMAGDFRVQKYLSPSDIQSIPFEITKLRIQKAVKALSITSDYELSIKEFLSSLFDDDVVDLSLIPLKSAFDVRVQKHLKPKDRQWVQYEAVFHFEDVAGFNAIFKSSSSQDQILQIYRSVKEKKFAALLKEIKSEHALPNVLLDMIRNGQRGFESAISKLMDHVLEVAQTSSDDVRMPLLLPMCPNEASRVGCCEARLWPKKPDPYSTIPVVEDRAYCPRLSDACLIKGLANGAENPYRHEGARLYADKSAGIKDWCLVDFLDVLGIVPAHPHVKPPEYITRLSGWVNRLNELRERMKCSLCNTTYLVNMKYAKNMAAYNATVFSCPNCNQEVGHDENVYLSHCWACTKIIDSRECLIRVGGLYLCLHCGSGPKEPTKYQQGTVCPKCGKLRVIVDKYADWNDDGRKKYCLDCHHKFRIPKASDITGLGIE